MRSISGVTRLAGIIGHPLEHTLSPAMHNAAYEVMGVDCVYVPLHVVDECDLLVVLAAVRSLPFVGVNVTMPYKETVLCLCDEVAETATLAGAVNTIQCHDGRLIGYNTDGRGLVEALAADAGFDPSGRNVVLLGAGGAAAAALISLALAHANGITVLNRDEGRARALVDRVSGQLAGAELSSGSLTDDAELAVREADLVVNATPLGMHAGDPSPVPASWLRRGQVVADMVYGPLTTSLVSAAQEAGAVALDGLGMLVCQGATAIEIWHAEAGVQAPRDVMRAAAAAMLESHAHLREERDA